MMRIYTPEEWHSLFDCPSLVIDEEGKIWAADEYYKILFGEPSGRIDYTGGKIYGKDLGYGMFSEPIAYLETKNGVTRVLDAKKGLFSSPILYIQNDKVYTPEQWTSIFDSPGGYIRKDGHVSNGPVKYDPPRDSGGSSGRPFFLGGEIGIFAGIVIILLIGQVVDAISSDLSLLAYAFVPFLTMWILQKVCGGMEIARMGLSVASGGVDGQTVSLCKKNAAICAALAVIPSVASGIWWASKRPLVTLFIIGLIPSFVLYWGVYLLFRNAMLMGKLRCWPMQKASQKSYEKAQDIPAGQKSEAPKWSATETHSAAIPPVMEWDAPKTAPLESKPSENQRSAEETLSDAERTSPQKKTVCNTNGKKVVKVKAVVKAAPEKQPPEEKEEASPAVDTAPPKHTQIPTTPAEIQALEIEETRAHPYSTYIAEQIAKEWIPGGQMYDALSDPALMVDRMTLMVTPYTIRFNVECDDSTTMLYEALPQSVWEKDYPLISFEQSIDPRYVGYTAPLTNAQKFGLHERLRDELKKLPCYQVSHGKGTLTSRSTQTNEIYYMSTLFNIAF